VTDIGLAVVLFQAFVWFATYRSYPVIAPPPAATVKLTVAVVVPTGTEVIVAVPVGTPCVVNDTPVEPGPTP
jgi:hypothetical protein